MRIGKKKLGAWFNVPFLVQMAHMSKPCERVNWGRIRLDGDSHSDIPRNFEGYQHSRNTSLYSKRDEQEFKMAESYCKYCKRNFYHYKFLHVEKWVVLDDPLDITSWENKIERLEVEEEKCLSRIDRNINTTLEALNSSERDDNNYLFSSYLGSVIQKKNILLNKIDTIINVYDAESKKTKYEMTLNHGDFSKQKYHPHKRVIFYFKRC